MFGLLSQTWYLSTGCIEELLEYIKSSIIVANTGVQVRCHEFAYEGAVTCGIECYDATRSIAPIDHVLEVTFIDWYGVVTQIIMVIARPHC